MTRGQALAKYEFIMNSLEAIEESRKQLMKNLPVEYSDKRLDVNSVVQIKITEENLERYQIKVLEDVYIVNAIDNDGFVKVKCLTNTCTVWVFNTSELIAITNPFVPTIKKDDLISFQYLPGETFYALDDSFLRGRNLKEIVFFQRKGKVIEANVAHINKLKSVLSFDI